MQAKAVEPPDVKRARGVYYTPAYVVDYILRATLGDDDAGGPVRIVDPACGCGAFLTRAYQRLLDRRPSASPADRVAILRESIYGVDVDRAAVHEARAALATMAGDAQPGELADNIRCGDALVGTDFCGEPIDVLPFDWEQAFPAAAGGFDVVVGNPPYVSFYSRESRRPPRELQVYFSRKFGPAVGGRLNTYLLFLAQGLRILRPGGRMGMIVPDTLVHNESYESVRASITRAGVSEISLLGFPVFADATVGSAIIILDPETDGCKLSEFRSKKRFRAGDPSRGLPTTRARLLAAPACRWCAAGSHCDRLLRKIEAGSTALNELAEVRDGINPGPAVVRTRILNPSGPARATWRAVIEGRHVQRYVIAPTDEVVDYDPSLLSREDRGKGASLRAPHIFAGEKLVSRQTADRLIFAFDEPGLCTLNSVHNTLARDGRRETLLALLGILNSRLMTFYYRRRSQETRRSFPQVHISALRKLPMRGPEDTDLLVGMVSEMIERRRQTHGAPDHRISRLDAMIDRAIYDLYGLTAAEIEMVEGDDRQADPGRSARRAG